MKEKITAYKIVDYGWRPFHGYMVEAGSGVIIRCIRAKKPNNGDFKRLIKHLKKNYDFIKIPNPSLKMKQIAMHLGLKEEWELFPKPFGCKGMIMYWEKRDGKSAKLQAKG